MNTMTPSVCVHQYHGLCIVSIDDVVFDSLFFGSCYNLYIIFLPNVTGRSTLVGQSWQQPGEL